MNFVKKLKSSEYSFLKDVPELGTNIMLLTVGGSYAYGLETENSDLDIRGIAIDTLDNLYGLSNFNQYVDANTDTTIFGLRRSIKLLSNGTITLSEMLGSNPEHILYMSNSGKLLMEHKQIFVTKNMARTFAGVAKGKISELEIELKKYMVNQPNKADKVATYIVKWYMQAINILKNNANVTFWGHYPILKEIRAGEYNQDGIYSKNYFDLLANLECNFQIALNESEIPEFVDKQAVSKLIKEMTKGRY